MIRVAIISPNKDVYSETFIKAHVDLLKGEKFFLYGAYKPIYFSEKSLVLLLSSLKRLFLKYILRVNLLDFSIRQFLIKNKINIILAEYGPTGCAILEIAKNLKIPLIVHFHGYDASSKKLLNEYRAKYCELFEYSSNLVAVSMLMKERLIKIGADERKILYTPCGPDPGFGDINPDYDNSVYALFVGRFVEKKAPWLLIELMRRIQSKGVGIILIMVGDGALFETCRGLVKIHNLGEKVRLLGSVSHDEVKKLMAQAFCYIQQSITTIDEETEGTPVSILEASLAGLPVISTRHAGIPDIVIHEETGLLVDEFDIDTMAEYLIKLFWNRNLAREMGSKAKKRINDHFTLEKHISKLDSILEKAVNGY